MIFTYQLFINEEWKDKCFIRKTNLILKCKQTTFMSDNRKKEDHNKTFIINLISVKLSKYFLNLGLFIEWGNLMFWFFFFQVLHCKLDSQKHIDFSLKIQRTMSQGICFFYESQGVQDTRLVFGYICWAQLNLLLLAFFLTPIWSSPSCIFTSYCHFYK